MWDCLEKIHGLVAVPWLWRQWLGDEFEEFAKAFMRRYERRAASVPCPLQCGCGHDIVDHGGGRLVAICACDPWNCEDIQLTAEDVVLWQLSWERFGRALATALNCQVQDAQLGLFQTRQIGAFGAGPLPIMLTMVNTKEQFCDTTAQLVARHPQGFILLAPTSRLCTASATDLMGRVNAGFFSLEAQVRLEGGRLYSAKSGGELFAAHLPEMKEAFTESESARVFRLFGELMGMGTELKASPARVFDLMVMKGRSQAEAAGACRCVRSLITVRVAMIEGHFRMPIETLRNFASDLKERQATVKGDRNRGRKKGGEDEYG